MAVNINIASSGYVGPINLSSGVISANGTEQNLQPNIAYVIQGTTATTLNLPAQGAGASIAGQKIILKLLDDAEITVSATNVPIDGASDNLELTTKGQVIAFYYINSTIGWMAGPAEI